MIFKNFLNIKNNKIIKKDFLNLIKNQPLLFQTLKPNYKYSYSKKLITKYKKFSSIKFVDNISNFNLNPYTFNSDQNNVNVATVNHIDSRNNYRMPNYHRLDVSVNMKKEKKWGERTWSFGLYNAYSRQNPFYLEFTRNENGNPQLSQFSLFPLIPSFTYSFKF